MSNDLKHFIKSAAIFSAIALSGSHTNASTKETNSTNYNIQVQQNTEPKYSFNDDKCYDLLSSAILKSNRSENDFKLLIKKYIAKMNGFYSKDQNTYNLSMKNYTEVLKDIGCTSIEVIKGKKAFLKMIQEQENLFYQNQVSKELQNNKDNPIHVINDENISYYADKGKLHISGSSSGNFNHLIPQLYKTSDGLYRCGSSVGDDKDFVLQTERFIIKNLATEHLVYKDILHRQKSGETLRADEQDFVQKFSERLSAEGLHIDDKYNLKQKDPRYKTNDILTPALRQTSR